MELGLIIGLSVIVGLVALTILSGILAIESGEMMHAVFFLGVLLVIIGELYILLGAEFVGVVQILVYAGGVTVLMLFTLLFIPRTKERLEKPFMRIPSLITVILLLSIILMSIGYVSPRAAVPEIGYENIVEILHNIAELLVVDYKPLIGIVALVIFIVMIASAYISSVKRE